MKKNFLFVLLLSISTIVSAQDTQKPVKSDSKDSKLSFGVKGGYSLSNMKFFDTKLDSKSSFYVGIVAEQPISSKVSVQAEALYTQLGGKESYWYEVESDDPLLNSFSGNIETYFKFTQIQIPVSLKYYFIPKLSASIGMNFGINVSEKENTDQTMNARDSQNYKNIKTLNLFPFLGAEYKITDHFFADARYHFNFIEANKGALETKIGFLQAGVGYRFK
ncbi:opacity protein-like surface antigen [Chryseobacterium ginsenosidimutans]|uniref:porin family protein n=1 Tax=Chryseobacterium ginsenosidimutans TaxID=687846 RepID=UPI00216A0030|nr:porin family protein [Chryseobacterium ginsenosidimutans]MCS3868684.1 opacity protein-like surface antigen [Chryseobacterium ginsenosidimutans]